MKRVRLSRTKSNNLTPLQRTKLRQIASRNRMSLDFSPTGSSLTVQYTSDSRPDAPKVFINFHRKLFALSDVRYVLAAMKRLERLNQKYVTAATKTVDGGPVLKNKPKFRRRKKS